MTPRMWLVRHGQTDWNLNNRFQGQSDVALNATGVRQAESLASRLAQLYPATSAEKICAIYASSLQRAAFTAEIIRGKLSCTQEIAMILEPRLVEMSFGAWEGLTFAEIQAKDPEHLARWLADRESVAPPQGETLIEFAGRVGAAYNDICAAHPDGTVLLVAHGGPLQVLIATALGLPPGRFWQFHLSNASLSELRIYPEGAILNLLNSCEHLDETGVRG